MKRMVLLMNETAGSVAGSQTASLAERLSTLFLDFGIHLKVDTLRPDALETALRQAAAGEWDALIAGGGDGTVGVIAGALAGTQIPLAVLPLGTYNHFALDLTLPPDVKTAIRAIAESQPRPVDLAEVNGNYFVNNSSIGIYPHAVEERETLRRQHGFSKRWCMIWASLRVFFRRPLMRVRIEMNGSVIERMTPFVFVGNNRYAISVGQRFRTRLDEGQLSIFAARVLGNWGLLRLAWHALRDRLHTAEELDSWEATEVRIHTHKPEVRVALDGEVVRLRTPLCYRMHPGAIHVLAPM